MAHIGALPPIQRHLTAIDPETGKSVFTTTSLGTEIQYEKIPSGDGAWALNYATQGFPVDLNDGADIKVYEGYHGNLPGLTIDGGSVFRVVDFAPGTKGAMHVTESIDYGIVLEGRMETEMDSGETRQLNRGDIVIQRGTNHAWNNPHKEWARMMFVLLPAVTPASNQTAAAAGSTST